MFRYASCLLLYCTLSLSHPLPYAAPVPLGASFTNGNFIPPIPSVVPAAFPFAPTSRSLVPGYNNPYYNQYNRVGGPVVPIVSYSSEHVGDGSYAFSFTTADGKQVQENGYLKDAYVDNNGDPQGTQVVQGSYAYISPEGTPIQVNYVADENGFRPSGLHIPADGKSLAPLIAAGKERQLLETGYKPYNNRNRYNFYGQYNNPRHYDSKYLYDPPKINPFYNPYPNSSQNNNIKEASKQSP